MTICECSIHVEFEDVDSFGMVHHPNYLKYFERARSESLRRRGHSFTQLREQGIIFAIAKVEIAYMIPGKLDDECVVRTQCLKQRMASLHYHQQLYRENECLCEADILMVCTDLNLTPRRWPQFLRNII